jgi:hypothetical protein
MLPDSRICLLNLTIGAALKDRNSYFNYAKENVFSFVFLFNQKKDKNTKEEMKQLPHKLIKTAVKMEGTYYLPKILYSGKGIFPRVYPRRDDFFRKMLEYKPNEIFKTSLIAITDRKVI